MKSLCVLVLLVIGLCSCWGSFGFSARRQGATGSGPISTANLNGDSGTATTNSAVVVATGGAATLFVQVTGTWSGGTLSIEETGTPSGSMATPVWVTLPVTSLVNRTDGDLNGITSGSTGAWAIQVRGAQVRIVENGSWSSGTANVSLSAGAPVLGIWDGPSVPGLPFSLASGGLRSNGMTYLTSYSTSGEAVNVVTSTAAALTLSSGGDPSAPYFVVVTNIGNADAWVAPVSGNHTWICPAGTTTYIPFGGSTLYGLSTGSTTLCVTKVGY